ncbi:MAG TPA: hypothetical protein VG713_04975 [Pirellulales bacterium]|nr:hypothetical protein [Pirellulales bacterium]
MNWYRRKTWTANGRADFYARLARARASNRAQYLRIQAVELLDDPSPENVGGAIELLKTLLSTYPDQMQLAATYQSLGDCAALNGETSAALDYYREAFAQQRAFLNVLTNVHLSFALLVAEQQLRASYDEALAALDEFRHSLTFPLDDFREFVARAMIHAAEGSPKLAHDYACRALDEAAKSNSGFRNHPTLGLVGAADAARVERMRAIIEQNATG